MQAFTNYKRFPYAGYSQNLMEYFYIIGFSHDKINKNINKTPQNFVEPEILSVVNNNNNQINVVESDIILKQIFPYPINIIELNELKTRPKKQTVMFMLNPDDYTKPIKNPSCCSSLIFYESPKNNSKFIIPKAFCIVSQYPYFSFFNDLNKRIFEYFRKNHDIPIEIIIYNMLNFIPSPINFDLELNIFPLGEFTTNNIFHGGISNNSRSYSVASKNSNSSNNNINSTYKIKQLTGYPQMDIDIIKIFNILPVEDVIEIFLFLLLEIDMIFFSKKIDILNPIMYIFSKFTFPCDDSMYQWNIVTLARSEFSTDNIFSGKPGTLMLGVNCSYDENIDVLKVRGNCIIVDLDTNINNKNNKRIDFITSNKEEFNQVNNFRTFLRNSILSQNNYNYLYYPSAFSQNFYYQNFLRRLYCDISFYVNKIKNATNPFSTAQNVNNTGERATISGNSGNLINFEGNNSFDFFDYSDMERVYRYNKDIQEVFYNFMIKLLAVFYNFFKLKSILEKNIDVTDEKNSFFIKCSDKQNDNEFYESKFNLFNENEKYFFNNFVVTKRYDKFFSGYIVKYDANKMHKLAYQFSEEYIYILKSQAIDLNTSINVDENTLKSLSLIDQFYSHYNQISNIIQKSELYKDFNIFNEEFTCYNQIKQHLKLSNYQNESCKIYSITNKYTLSLNFEEFYKIYYDSLIKDIFKFDNINFLESIVGLTKDKKLITHQHCELENSFLFNYLYYLNNYFESRPREDVFLYYKICKINTIPTIKSTDVPDFIENEFLKFSNIDIDNTLIYSLINLFMIVIAEYCSSEFYSNLKEICDIIKQKKIWIRKYLELILNTYVDPRFSGECNDENQEKLELDENEPDEDISKRIQNIKPKILKNFTKRTSSYYIMVNFFRDQDILPTENFLKILNIILNFESKDMPMIGILDREEEDINYFVEISFKYNKCKCGYKKKDYFMQETISYREDENVFVNCKTCKEIQRDTIFVIKIAGNGIDTCFSCEIFSIRKILQISRDFLSDYFKHFDIKKLDYELLKKLGLNLIFYCENDTYKAIKPFLYRTFKSIIKMKTI